MTSDDVASYVELSGTPVDECYMIIAVQGLRGVL